MIGEINVAGVFVPAVVIWALGAVLLGAFVRRILNVTRFYALVWHRGLFNLALFFILWGLVAAVANRFGLPAWIDR